MILYSNTAHTHTHTNTHTHTHTITQHTHTHTHKHHKIFPLFNIYKYNIYEYNEHNLISKSGYRFVAQHCSNVNITAGSYNHVPTPPPQKKQQTTKFKKHIYQQENK